MKYSVYQQDFFDKINEFFVTPNPPFNYILLNAVAGSGKTFSLVESIKFLPKKNIPIKFFAFNKSIADELANKVPSHCDVSTLHSYGMSTLRSYLKGVEIKVVSFKSWKYVEQYIKDNNLKFETLPKKTTFIMDVCKLVDMYRVNLCETSTETMEDTIKELVMKYDVQLDEKYPSCVMNVFLELKRYNEKFIIKGKREVFDIDFIDMVYLPSVYKQMPVKQYKLMYVDECQDLSKSQLVLTERALLPNGLGVFVGDKNQAIYAFAGADDESFNILENRPNTVKLPLSVCYRCGKSIVMEAKPLVPHIEYFDGSDEGEVVTEGSVYNAIEGEWVLCRNLKPLVQLWISFIKSEKKCFIKGKDLGKNLLNLISKVENFEIELALEKLDDLLIDLEQKLIESNVKRPKKHKKYVQLEEDIAIIKTISESYHSMKTMITAIERMFSDTDDKNSIQMMTMHKSKGLENDVVYLVRLDLIPSRFATKQYQLDQEKNLLYVAITRAKKKLVMDVEFI